MLIDFSLVIATLYVICFSSSMLVIFYDIFIFISEVGYCGTINWCVIMVIYEDLNMERIIKVYLQNNAGNWI